MTILLFSRLKADRVRKAISSHGLPVALLTIATLALFLPSLRHEFLANWDDNSYVTANECVRGFSLEHVRLAFSRIFVGNYAPIQIVSYMVDYSLWGMVAHGFILTNVLLHIGNGILYYFLVVRIAAGRLLAFVSAAIFLVHPVQVESVVWISQRKNVLAMFFFLIAAHYYLRYRLEGTRRSYWGAFAAFVLALLCKSVVVILPLILILYDICFPLPSRRIRWLSDNLPFLLAAGLVAAGALLSQNPEYKGGITSWHGGTSLNTFYTMLPVFFSYLRLLVWPSGQSAFYDPLIRTGPDAVVIIALIAILIMGVVGKWLFGRNRRLFFCFAVYVVALLPVAQIVPLVTLMNDRYLYFPMLGIAPVAGAAADYVVGHCHGWRRTLLSVVIGGLLFSLMVVSWTRTKVWQNSQSLWRDAVQKSPTSDNAWAGLGDANRSAQDLNGALTAYLRALTINPGHEKALHGIGYVYLQLGKPQDARPYLKKTTELFPQLASGFEHLGHSYYMTKEYTAAESIYRKALALNPKSAPTLLYLGNIALGAGRLDSAESFFTQALRYDGPAGDIEYSLACLYAKKMKPEAALVHLQRALAGGFRDVGLIVSNPELAVVRKSPEFARLISLYEQSNRLPEQDTRSSK